MRKGPLLILSLSLFVASCNKHQVGYFNNSHPQYSRAQQNTNSEVQKTETAPLEASSESKEIQLTKPQELAVAKEIVKEQSKPVATTTTANMDVKAEAKKLSKQERKDIKKQLRTQMKNQTNASGLGTVILVIFAIILPPLAVALVDGLSGPFWLSILLTLLFYVPGLIYALWRVFRSA